MLINAEMYWKIRKYLRKWLTMSWNSENKFINCESFCNWKSIWKYKGCRALKETGNVNECISMIFFPPFLQLQSSKERYRYCLSGGLGRLTMILMKRAIRDDHTSAHIYYPRLKRTKILFTQLSLKKEKHQFTRGWELTNSSSDTQRSVQRWRKASPICDSDLLSIA